MDELAARIDRLIAQEGLPWVRKDSVVEVELYHGRRQRVRVAERDGTLQFWSRILPSGFVRDSNERWGQLALRAWRKNAHADLVGFGFDHRDRLIGLSEYPGLQPGDGDLRLYIEAVAKESDRLEHVLLGMDRN